MKSKLLSSTSAIIQRNALRQNISRISHLKKQHTVGLFQQPKLCFSTTANTAAANQKERANPYKNSFPFHFALPVHNLEEAKKFYGGVLGLPEGRSSAKWQDYDLYGNQIVCHWVGEEYKGRDFYNPVDGDEVPVAHFGACLSEQEFDDLAAKLKEANVEFIIEPHLRFEGKRGAQKTMFFKDPSNNNLEFKSMTNPDYLFEKEGNY